MKGILISFIFVLLQLQLVACSCSGPDKFINSIGSHILEVEIIDVYTIDTSRHAYTVTSLKVKSVLKGEYNKDTIYILNDQGFECFHSLPDREEGMKYIVTGELLDEWSSSRYKMASSYEGNMMVLGLCSENYLFVKGDRVIGNITKNKLNKNNWKQKLYRKLISKNAFGNWNAHRRSPSKSEQLMQNISMNRFIKKLSIKELI
jgi:hypothetical protein